MGAVAAAAAAAAAVVVVVSVAVVVVLVVVVGVAVVVGALDAAVAVDAAPGAVNLAVAAVGGAAVAARVLRCGLEGVAAAPRCSRRLGLVRGQGQLTGGQKSRSGGGPTKP